MSDTVIKSCSPCKPNDYQDKTFGKGNRAMNATNDKPPKHRCTVCGAEKG